MASKRILVLMVVLLGISALPALAAVANGGLGYNLTDISISSGGMINLGNFAGISHSDTYSELRTYLRSGRGTTASPTWTGYGINSSVAAVTPNKGYTVLGILSGTEWKVGKTSTYKYFGISYSSIASTDMLISYTWLGDINLDGLLNATDLSRFNSYYNLRASVTNTYGHGDLNLDGTINATDLSVFNSYYNLRSTVNIFSGATASSSLESVPEPSTIVLFLISICAFVWKRLKF